MKWWNEIFVKMLGRRRTTECRQPFVFIHLLLPVNENDDKKRKKLVSLTQWDKHVVVCQSTSSYSYGCSRCYIINKYKLNDKQDDDEYDTEQKQTKPKNEGYW